MTRSKEDSGNEQLTTPARLLVLTALAVFVGEFLVMLLLARLPPISIATEALLDASLITTLVAPFLYLFLFRPMAAQIRVREEAEAELRRLNESLEERVRERTEELSRGAELLRLQIEERRRAEDSLWKSNEFVRSVIESAPCLFLIYEFDRRRCSYVNGVVTDLLGYEPEDVCREDRDFLRQILDDQAYKELQEVSVAATTETDGIVFGGQYRLRDSEGDSRSFSVKAVALGRNAENAVGQILLAAIELEVA